MVADPIRRPWSRRRSINLSRPRPTTN